MWAVKPSFKSVKHDEGEPLQKIGELDMLTYHSLSCRRARWLWLYFRAYSQGHMTTDHDVARDHLLARTTTVIASALFVLSDNLQRVLG